MDAASPAPNTKAGRASDDADALPWVDVELAFCELLLDIPSFVDVPPNACEKVVLKDLAAIADAGLDRLPVLPRLPAVLPELLTALRDPDITAPQLARIISRDPTMVGAVSRVAGSAYFRTAHPVTSVTGAVLLLGHNGLRRLLPTVAMRPIFHAEGGLYSNLAGSHAWTHAQRCGLACLAFSNAHEQGFELYLAGMALGAGLITVVRSLDRHAQTNAGLLPLRSTTFAREAMATSRKLALGVAGQWELPERTMKVLRYRLRDISKAGHGRMLAQAEYVAMYRALVSDGRHEENLAEISAAYPDLSRGLLQRCYADLVRLDEAEPPT